MLNLEQFREIDGCVNNDFKSKNPLAHMWHK